MVISCTSYSTLVSYVQCQCISVSVRASAQSPTPTHTRVNGDHDEMERPSQHPSHFAGWQVLSVVPPSCGLHRPGPLAEDAATEGGEVGVVRLLDHHQCLHCVDLHSSVLGDQRTYVRTVHVYGYSYTVCMYTVCSYIGAGYAWVCR